MKEEKTENHLLVQLAFKDLKLKTKVKTKDKDREAETIKPLVLHKLLHKLLVLNKK